MIVAAAGQDNGEKHAERQPCGKEMPSLASSSLMGSAGGMVTVFGNHPEPDLSISLTSRRNRLDADA